MKKIFSRTAIASALIVLGGCGSSAGTNSADPGYTTVVRDAFVNSCSSEGDYNKCVCAFDYITRNLSYVDFVSIENELSNGASVDDYSIFIDAANSCM